MERLKQLSSTAKNRLLSLASSKATMVKVIVYLILAVIIIGLFVYINNKLKLRSTDCLALSDMYPDAPTIATMSDFKGKHSHALRDYYIKSSYNSCNPGEVKNAYVDLCALDNAIKQGCRVLDFAVYSINGKACVASSTSASYDVKDTYNSIEIGDVMKRVRDRAFSGAHCSNSGDPLILHFRIMSAYPHVADDIASALSTNLGSRTLGSKYSNQFGGQNLGALPIETFMGKAIICVDKSNDVYMGTKLDEWINICSNSPFLRGVRFSQVKFSHDTNELTEFNKKNMTIVMPDKTNNITNPASALCMHYGCQMTAMAMQKQSANLTSYNNKFNQEGYAFILKPENLRYKPVTIDIPAPPPQSYSYAQRQSSTDFYSFTI